MTDFKLLVNNENVGIEECISNQQAHNILTYLSSLLQFLAFMLRRTGRDSLVWWLNPNLCLLTICDVEVG